LIGYHAKNNNFTLKPDAIIHMNELYGKLKGSEQTIGDILNDTTDLKGLLKATTEPDAYSGSKLPPIPDECCHPFHFKAATDSG
jgi:hypothetical protein